MNVSNVHKAKLNYDKWVFGSRSIIVISWEWIVGISFVAFYFIVFSPWVDNWNQNHQWGDLGTFVTAMYMFGGFITYFIGKSWLESICREAISEIENRPPDDRFLLGNREIGRIKYLSGYSNTSGSLFLSRKHLAGIPSYYNHPTKEVKDSFFYQLKYINKVEYDESTSKLTFLITPGEQSSYEFRFCNSSGPKGYEDAKKEYAKAFCELLKDAVSDDLQCTKNGNKAHRENSK
jgi:hypothetical protein